MTDIWTLRLWAERIVTALTVLAIVAIAVLVWWLVS